MVDNNCVECINYADKLLASYLSDEEYYALRNEYFIHRKEVHEPHEESNVMDEESLNP